MAHINILPSSEIHAALGSPSDVIDPHPAPGSPCDSLPPVSIPQQFGQTNGTPCLTLQSADGESTYRLYTGSGFQSYRKVISVSPGLRRVLVNHLAPDVETGDLYELFSSFGTVIHCVIIGPSSGTSAPTGYGFVSFADVVSAERAVDEGHGTAFYGKTIGVYPAIGQAEAAPNARIYVSGFPICWTLADFHRHFESSGPVRMTKILSYSNVGYRTGFVTFCAASSATQAIQSWNNKFVNGCLLKVARINAGSGNYLSSQLRHYPVFFGNLGPNHDEIFIRSILVDFELHSVKVIRGNNRNYAFANFAIRDEAVFAASVFNLSELDAQNKMFVHVRFN